MSVQQAERELVALHQEIARLDQQIGEAQERATKLQHYIEVATEFERGSDTVYASTSPGAVNVVQANGSRGRVPQGGMSGRAISKSIAALRERGHPIPTTELLKIIEGRGVKLGGAKPVNALSGYLSRTPGLSADRTLGWSLDEWRQTQGSPDVLKTAFGDFSPRSNNEGAGGDEPLFKE